MTVRPAWRADCCCWRWTSPARPLGNRGGLRSPSRYPRRQPWRTWRPAVALGPNGRASFAYAGDRHGQVWRFDLRGAPPWPQALGRNDLERRQPLLSPRRARAYASALSGRSCWRRRRAAPCWSLPQWMPQVPRPCMACRMQAAASATWRANTSPAAQPRKRARVSPCMPMVEAPSAQAGVSTCPSATPRRSRQRRTGQPAADRARRRWPQPCLSAGSPIGPAGRQERPDGPRAGVRALGHRACRASGHPGRR